MHEEIIFKGQTQYTPYSDTVIHIQYALCEGFSSSPFSSSPFYFVARSSVPSLTVSARAWSR